MGPSLIGHQSLFLYGGTGNGKTSIAERILRIYHDTVVVPYAVEVDGHIISLFDPVVHRQLPFHDDMLDPRWAVCERPCITVGGELSAAMLELRLDESTKVFISPCQMKANNGILIIDDFGRQMLAPRDLLNRWIVPLDRRVDYLTLSSGMKFQVPFEMMVVFSTNLDPHDLADEAFLRRIQTKVMVENVSAEVFDEIFRRVMVAQQVPTEPGCAEYLRERCEEYAVERAARLLPDGHLPAGEGDQRIRRASGADDARQHRSRGSSVFRQERTQSVAERRAAPATLFQNTEHIGEFVGPDAERAALTENCGVRLQLGVRRGGGAVHDEGPGAGEAHGVVVLRVPVVDQGDLVEGAGGAFHDGVEGQVGVGDVHGQDAGGFQVAEVDGEGLAGDEVDGDGIAGEGVHHEDVEQAGWGRWIRLRGRRRASPMATSTLAGVSLR